MKAGIVAVLVALGLAACTTVSGVDNSSFVSGQQAEARRLQEQGRLAEALVHWQIVAAVRSGDSEAASQIDKLNADIAARRDEYDAKGKSALAKGQRKQAEAYFLKALSYDERDEEARRQLREMILQVLWRRQAKKDAQAQAPQLAD